MIEFPIELKGEARFGVMARYGGAVWVAICTMRGDVVRIISVRRASAREVSAYDRARSNDR